MTKKFRKKQRNTYYSMNCKLTKIEGLQFQVLYQSICKRTNNQSYKIQKFIMDCKITKYLSLQLTKRIKIGKFQIINTIEKKHKSSH